MGKKKQLRQQKKLSAPHILVFIALVVALFLFFQYIIIPRGIAEFVVSLFKPSGEKLEKIGFVKFEDEGLVWASMSKANEEKVLKEGIKNIRKDLINKEYIFDFTFKERNEKEHGYVKSANEFYAKSEVLGEHAIILEPWIGFWILALVLAFICSILITLVLPTSVGLMALLVDRQIDNTQAKIRLQTDFSNEVVDLLIMPDDKLRMKEPSEVEALFKVVWERTEGDHSEQSKFKRKFEDVFQDYTDMVAFRQEVLYTRIKEYFSDFVLKEIEDTKDGLEWRRNHLQIFKGIRLYMAHHFTEKYSNNVTGLAYGGAAFLIVAVGIRGLKFIPPTKPSFILLAIFLEFSMLSLLAITLIYTEEEERMDRMLKKMEDANRNQLETLRDQQQDIRTLANALVGETAQLIQKRVEMAVEEYMKSSENLEKVTAQEISRKINEALREYFAQRKEE